MLYVLDYIQNTILVFVFKVLEMLYKCAVMLHSNK